MSGIQPTGSGIPTINPYRLAQQAKLPASLETDFNLPPGTEPCDRFSIQGRLNSPEGEEYTAKDLHERLFLNNGAPYQSAILDGPDQKIAEADRARLTQPENLKKLGRLISDHNGGALISGELTFQYRTYLYTCYQQKVEQGLIKDNPNKDLLNSVYRFYTHGPQGRRPYIKVPVAQMAKLISELLVAKTTEPVKAAKPAAPGAAKPAVKLAPKPPVQPVVVDKPVVKPAVPSNQSAPAPFMPF